MIPIRPLALVCWFGLLTAGSATSSPASAAEESLKTPPPSVKSPNAKPEMKKADAAACRELAEQIAKAEALYENIDVSVTRTIVTEKGDQTEQELGELGVMKRREEEKQYVSQNGMIFVSGRFTNEVFGKEEKKTGHSKHSFDGTHSYYSDSDMNSNVRPGKGEGVDEFRPHMLPFSESSNALRHRLSTVIDGTSPRFSTRACEIAAIKRSADSRDEPIVEVQFNFVDPKDQEYPIDAFWIVDYSVKQNYLPVRGRVYLVGNEGSNTLADEFVMELSEIRPGLYFPKKFVLTVYHAGEVQRDARVVNNIRTTEVHKVDFAPNYPKSFFEAVAKSE